MPDRYTWVIMTGLMLSVSVTFVAVICYLALGVPLPINVIVISGGLTALFSAARGVYHILKKQQRYALEKIVLTGLILFVSQCCFIISYCVGASPACSIAEVGLIQLDWITKGLFLDFIESYELFVVDQTLYRDSMFFKTAQFLYRACWSGLSAWFVAVLFLRVRQRLGRNE